MNDLIKMLNSRRLFHPDGTIRFIDPEGYTISMTKDLIEALVNGTIDNSDEDDSDC